MLFAFILGINEDVIKVHYYKNVKLFCQNLVDIVLERGRCVNQSKRHHLVLEIAIASFEGRLLFIAFLNLYLMVGIGQIKLNEMSNPT